MKKLQEGTAEELDRRLLRMHGAATLAVAEKPLIRPTTLELAIETERKERATKSREKESERERSVLYEYFSSRRKL